MYVKLKIFQPDIEATSCTINNFSIVTGIYPNTIVHNYTFFLKVVKQFLNNLPGPDLSVQKCALHTLGIPVINYENV